MCGATILANLKLDHDLACAGGGLIVGADGIKLDLNGHTITGSGTGDGINVTGRTNVSIFGGTIRNFGAGVLTNTATGIVIKRNEFLANVDGIDLQAGSRGNTIKHNTFRDSSEQGDHDQRQLNRPRDYGRIRSQGIALASSCSGASTPPSRGNLVSASILAGIRINILGTGNLIVKNFVMSNPAGIEFLVSGTQSAVGNTVVRNTIELNTCGLKGPVGGNTVEKNRFKENGADSCM